MKKNLLTSAMMFGTLAMTDANALDRERGWEAFATIGISAVSSDIAGIGTLLPFDAEEDLTVVIQVEEVFFGNTNQQTITVGNPLPWLYPVKNFSPEAGRMVFLAYTNFCEDASLGKWFYDMRPRIDPVPFANPSIFELTHPERTWFSPDIEDGLLFAYLTNIIHSTRIESNWTNVYEVTRSGLTSTSERVRFDSRHDFGSLIKYGSHDQLLFMKNDPLFPAALKEYLPK